MNKIEQTQTRNTDSGDNSNEFKKVSLNSNSGLNKYPPWGPDNTSYQTSVPTVPLSRPDLSQPIGDKMDPK